VAYYLLRQPDQLVTFPSLAWTSNVWAIEFDIRIDATFTTGEYLISSSSGDVSTQITFQNGGNTLRLRAVGTALTNYDFNVTTIDLSIRHKFKIESDGSDLSLIVDGIPLETKAGDAIQPPNALVGLFSTFRDRPDANLELYGISFSGGFASQRNYNPSSSSGTGSVLPDALNASNDGTLVNFDPLTAWVEYFTAIDPTFWQKKVEIKTKNTIPSIADPFVSLVTEANLPAEIWDIAESGGGDIRVCLNEDGTGRLPLEIVNFDTVNQKAVMWSRSPNINPAQGLWLFYGKAGETQPAVTDVNGRNAVNVDYASAWHLNTLSDSAGNANDLTVVGSPSLIEGIVGKSYKFASSSDYLHTDYVGVVAGTFNMSFWYQRDGSTDLPLNEAVLGIANSGNAFDNYAIVLNRVGADFKVALFARNSNTAVIDVVSIPNLPSSALVYISVNQDINGSTVTAIHNGVTYSGTSALKLQGSGFNKLSFNRLMDSSPISGGNVIIDEPRLTNNNISRPTAYIETEYANQSDPATFWETGVPQSTVSGPANVVIDFEIATSEVKTTYTSVAAAVALALNAKISEVKNEAQTLSLSGAIDLDLSASEVIISAAAFSVGLNFSINTTPTEQVTGVQALTLASQIATVSSESEIIFQTTSLTLGNQIVTQSSEAEVLIEYQGIVLDSELDLAISAAEVLIEAQDVQVSSRQLFNSVDVETVIEVPSFQITSNQFFNSSTVQTLFEIGQVSLTQDATFSTLPSEIIVGTQAATLQNIILVDVPSLQIRTETQSLDLSQSLSLTTSPLEILNEAITGNLDGVDKFIASVVEQLNETQTATANSDLHFFVVNAEQLTESDVLSALTVQELGGVETEQHCNYTVLDLLDQANVIVVRVEQNTDVESLIVDQTINLETPQSEIEVQVELVELNQLINFATTSTEQLTELTGLTLLGDSELSSNPTETNTAVNSVYVSSLLNFTGAMTEQLSTVDIISIVIRNLNIDPENIIPLGSNVRFKLTETTEQFRLTMR